MAVKAMIDYKVETTGAMNMTVPEVSRLLDRNSLTAVNAVMKQAQQIARAPIPSGPSGIKKSIEFEKAKLSTKVAVVATSHPKFEYVEERTKPHVIVAKQGKALAFKAGGKWVFRKRVNHPGTPGKHSFKQADAFVEANLYGQLQNAVDAALDGRAYSPLTANLISALTSLL